VTAGACSVHFDAERIPDEMRRCRQWVCWAVEIRRDKSGQLKPTKVPKDPRTGRNASVTDPSTWGTFEEAVAAAQKRGQGLGFVFEVGGPYTGIDLDGCRDPLSGSISAWAVALIRRFNSYSEVSPSGTGIKIFIEGSLIGQSGRRRGPIEIYSAKRFFTLTGDTLSSVHPHVEDRQAELDALVARLFPPPERFEPQHPQLHLQRSDHEVIERALRARNGDRFAKLWEGDWKAAGYSSQSEADLALLNHLAFWTSGDGAQMARLFESSGLCREKWLQRPDYRTATLSRALAGVGHA
jgi:putative DNA primase/helicase